MNRTRPLVWEDEAPAEPLYRRVRQDVSSAGHVRRDGPGDASPGSEPLRPDWAELDPSRPAWWRPSSAWGRGFLALAALILLGGLATAGFLLKNYLDRDSRFRIAGAGNIEAAGLSQVSRGEMLSVFGEDIGRNIFFVPLAERRKQLEQIPWVERAAVMRLLPDRIRVSVVERKPVAFVREGNEVRLVDADGVVLPTSAAAMAAHHYSFPVVTGINPQDPPAASKTRMAVYERMISELDAMGKHLSEQISEIDLTDPEDARVLMPEQGGDILAHFGEEHFLDRYQRYKAHIAEWRQQYPRLVAVDLRYDQQVVLKVAPGTGDQQITTAEAASNMAKPKSATDGPAKRAHTARQTVHTKSTKAGANQNRTVGAKSKTASQKAKEARDRKRLAAARRTAFDMNRHKKPHPATAARPGE